MRRKVIQLAGKTAVVSLPSKWIKRYKVEKGDELDIEEIGNHILIKPQKQKSETKKISFNIEDFNERTLRTTISALHKSGYDEITLYFETQKLNKAIQDLTKNLLLGFVVIDQTSKKVVLKNVSNELESEFNPTLRRAFLVSNSLAVSSLEMISNKNFDHLPSLISLEMSNNQLTSFCLRLINKGFYQEQDKKLFLITIIWNLEKITDEYKTICLQLSKNKQEISKDILEVYGEVNKFFNSYYELIYKFSIEKLNELVNKKEEIINNLNKMVPKTKYESNLMNFFTTVVSKTSDLSSSIVALNHEKLNQ